MKAALAEKLGRAAARRQAEALARERGWRVSEAVFNLRQLQTGSAKKWREYQQGYMHGLPSEEVDHPFWFRETKSPFRPVAVLAHNYGPAERCLAWAAANGLDVEVLPSSAYSTGTTAVLYMRRRART